MFFFGKSKRNDPKALRSGTVERVPSRMFAIPSEAASSLNRADLWKRLRDTDELTFGTIDQPPFTVTYKGIEYTFDTADVEFGMEEDDSSLAALKKLKVLGICSYQTSLNTAIKVKDLDFISKMPALEYVDVIDVRTDNG